MNILKTEKPKTIANILNGKQIILVMKKAPKKGVGCWWYLYCNKNGGTLCPSYKPDNAMRYVVIKDKYDDVITNGHIVARFWCDKVEEISWPIGLYELEQQGFNDFLDKCCLGFCEIKNYLNRKNGYAIHISDLEIFDRPKELSEFHTVNKIGIPQYQFGKGTCDYKKLTKAPQNYCYIEGEE